MTLRDDDFFVVYRSTDVGFEHKKVTWQALKEYLSPKMPWEDPSKIVWHITNLSKVASPEYDDFSNLIVGLVQGTQMEVYKLDSDNPTKNLADVANADDPDSVIFKSDGSNIGEEDAIQELIEAIQGINPDYPDFIPLVRIPPGGEYVIVHDENSGHPLFLSDNMSWDFGDLTRTNLVISMRQLLRGAWEFTGDVGNFNMENVADIYSMLPEKFNHPSIGSWNTRSMVTFHGLFESNHVFNQDISGWDMRRARDVSSMFNEAEAFNQDIGDWQFEDITQTSPGGEHSFSMMFISASSFNQDISRWCVENVATGPDGGSDLWMQDANPDFVSNTAFHPKWGEPCT